MEGNKLWCSRALMGTAGWEGCEGTDEDFCEEGNGRKGKR